MNLTVIFSAVSLQNFAAEFPKNFSNFFPQNMFTPALIAISFSLGFFVESIIGFGGGLIAYSILGFFIDLKQMVIAGLYIGTVSSGYIFFSSIKDFETKLFQKVALICLIGTICGVAIFSKFSSETLGLFFGTILALLSIKIIFFDQYVFPKIFQKTLLFLGGIAQGAFGIGGPFFVNALKDDFKNKSSLRATMAGFFLIFNIIRFTQLSLQQQIHLEFFVDILWTVIPVFLAIKLGHKVHLKISPELFKKGIAIMTIFAALKFIF